MTRQKKELIKQIEELQFEMECEYAMDGSGECGKFIEAAFEPLLTPLLRELDKLQKGNSVMDPFWIVKNVPAMSVASELPFN